MSPEEVLANVLLSVIGNVMTAVLFPSLGASQRDAAASSALPISQALERIDLRSLHFDPQVHDGVAEFLRSPSAYGPLRLLFTDSKDGVGRTQLEAEFCCLLARHLRHPFLADIERIGRSVFRAAEAAAHELLSAAIDRGSIPAHEAMEVARHRVLLSELREVGHNVHFLRTWKSPVVPRDVDAFESELRRQVANRTRLLSLSHLDNPQASRISLNAIFIDPLFDAVSDRATLDANAVEFFSLLNTLHRAVVLGDPGGGKSTMVQMASYRAASEDENCPLGGRKVTALPIVLRDFEAWRQRNISDNSIRAFLEYEIRGKYQVRLPDQDLVEFLLRSGRLAVFFDGLDELLEPVRRTEMVHLIEAFCSYFPRAPVLVTSRSVGYSNAPLDRRTFEIYRMREFADGQVAQYVQRWFRDSRGSDEAPDLKKKTEQFLRESRDVADLRRNPLLLSLMCNLYRGYGFIPRNRAEVYRKCTELLFEKWDPSRGIWVDVPLREPRTLLAYLAMRVFSTVPMQEIVGERDLVRWSVEYLHPQRAVTEEAAVQAGREFIAYCAGRVWILTEVGLSLDGERLFRFTHRTFLEFFTAVQAVRLHHSGSALWRFMESRVRDPGWDVVLQLACQLIHEQVDGALDVVIDGLLGAVARSEPRDRGAILSFLSRLYRGGGLTLDATSKVLDVFCETGFLAEGWPYGKDVVEDMFSAIVTVSGDRRLLGAKALQAAFERRASWAGYAVYELLWVLENLDVFQGTHLRLERAAEDFWRHWAPQALKNLHVDPESSFTTYCLAHRASLEADALIERFGGSSLFRPIRFRVSPIEFPSLAASIFRYLTLEGKLSDRAVAQLDAIGRAVVKEPVGFFGSLLREPDIAGVLPTELGSLKTSPVAASESHWAVGFWALLAGVAEVAPSSAAQFAASVVALSGSGALAADLGAVAELVSRRLRSMADRASLPMAHFPPKRLGVSPAAEYVMVGWSMDRIDLTVP